MSPPVSCAAAIPPLIMDVAGALSHRQVHCRDTGDAPKAFDIEDGLGLKLLHETGVKPTIITDRCD